MDSSLLKEGRAKKMTPRVFASRPTEREDRALNNVDETQHAANATAIKLKDTGTVLRRH